MLRKQNNSYHWILALVVVVLAPILTFITPEIISLFLFNQGEGIAFISYGKSFIMYALSFVIVFIVLLVFFLIKKLVPKLMISMIGFILFIYLNVVGTQYSIYSNQDYIEYNPLFNETQRYEWTKITKVVHELPTGIYEEKYIFEFSNGKKFEFFPRNALSDEMRNKLEEKIMTLEVSYEEY